MFVVKIPLVNGLGKTKGCEKSPNFLLEKLKEVYSSEGGKPIDVKMLDLEEIHVDNGDVEVSNKLIHENALEIFSEKPKTIFIGGDHSISYSLVRAFNENCKTNRREPRLVVFDAHGDCMPLTKGTGNYPNHEEWLRALNEIQGFSPKNILL